MSDKPSQTHKSSKSKSDCFLAPHINFLPWQLYNDDRAAGSYSASQEIGRTQPPPSQFTLLFMLSLTDKIWPNLDQWGGGSEALAWWILLHLDRNRKAAASSVPSLKAKLHNADAGSYFVMHPSFVVANLLQSVRENYHPNIFLCYCFPSRDVSHLVIGGHQTLPLPLPRFPPPQ